VSELPAITSEYIDEGYCGWIESPKILMPLNRSTESVNEEENSSEES
jgi:hypothetical protein